MGHPIPEIFYCSPKIDEEKTNKNKLIRLNRARSSSRSESALEIPSLGSRISTAHSAVTVEEPVVDKAPSTSQLPSPASNNSMPHKGTNLSLNLQQRPEKSTQPQPNVSKQPTGPLLDWDWDVEHEDRKKERKADAALRGAAPFEVDRRVLKDVVRERMGVEVGRIKFLSAGTFHKAYLITLVNYQELVARVARRFMPKLKVESEVATMKYLREKTNVPVPTVYHYDSNPYNRLGGEFILMSKAPGIPLAKVFHTLSYNDLVKLAENTARIIIPLFAHRFSQMGSLYSGSSPQSIAPSGAPTPKATSLHNGTFPFPAVQGISSFSPALTPRLPTSLAITPTPSTAVASHSGTQFHVGPIISWPFFGSNRGFLSHPKEINRGPWSTTHSYLSSCADREIEGVISENEGRSAPHRLHLDPDEIMSSRHHRLNAVPGDESDDSDEYDLEESEEEEEGPGDVMYRDYRRMQRSTFLFTHMVQREQNVRKEMGRWMRVMERLIDVTEENKDEDWPEGFGLDCHDLSLENVFVDEIDNTKITCVIDWESTTTRPLWACAHLPAFVQSSPFIAKLFRQAVTKLPNDPSIILPPGSQHKTVESLCREWLYYEQSGVRLRMAHRCAEWDGWEEGLVDSILGVPEVEDEWFNFDPLSLSTENGECHSSGVNSPVTLDPDGNTLTGTGDSPGSGGGGKVRGRKPSSSDSSRSRRSSLSSISLHGAKLPSKLPFVGEQKKEQMLNTTGDICGGRGGELGRRLEAWLSVNEDEKTKDASSEERIEPAIGVVGAVLNKERWLEGQRTVVALDC